MNLSLIPFKVITALILTSMVLLLNSCAKNASPAALDHHDSDFAVLGPDGAILNGSTSEPGAIHEEKVYWGGSGANPATAPRWKNATVNWYYSPAGQPSVFTTEQSLALIQKGMSTWSSVCNIHWNYQGITTRTTAANTDGYVTIGWGGAHGYTGGFTTVQWDGNLNFSDSDIELSNTGFKTTTAFSGVINHELGHQLGLNHSDVSESIMFANPYHTVDYMLSLRADDVSGCVGLYGASLAAPTPTPTPKPTPHRGHR